MVEIWLDVWVMMFLFSKCTKLNVLLIFVHEPKTTTKVKRREYMLANCYSFMLNPLLNEIKKTIHKNIQI